MQSTKKNRGEWSELYVFCQLILKNTLPFGDTNGRAVDNDFLTILKLAHDHEEAIFNRLKNGKLQIVKNDGAIVKELLISEAFDEGQLKIIFDQIRNGVGRTFNMDSFIPIMNKLNIQKFKGNSSKKADIWIGFDYQATIHDLDPMGIKSYAGGAPTLLNSSKVTNFIYEITNFTGSVNQVNAIESRSKIKDRVKKILAEGGVFTYTPSNDNVHEKNLRMVDSKMPELLAEVLIKYYRGDGCLLSSLVVEEQKIARFKDYLKAVVLGMFSSKEWDGNYTSNGTIILHDADTLVLYHVMKDKIFKDYFFSKTKLDTPASRNGFGKLYIENNKIYMKLNLQIRSI
ncbi:HpaII family restriction endonuclease [Arenimonas sp.]|nr:HpaII family restriction endonuclease [Candidatus Parcubacteria bacterium]